MIANAGVLRSWLAASLVLSFSGCLEPLDAPRAYDEITPLCGDEAAWLEALEDCRADFERDESCAGLLHFEGQLDGIELAVASRLFHSEFEDKSYPSGAVLRDDMSVEGTTPYNEFSLSYRGLGGEVGPDAELIELPTDPVDGSISDAAVDGTFRISNGFQSQDIRVAGGVLRRTLQTETEASGTFTTAYGSEEDVIDGCFHVFAVDRYVEPGDPVDDPMPDERARGRRGGDAGGSPGTAWGDPR